MNLNEINNQLDLLPQYLGGHLTLTVLALALGIFICIPLGCLVSRVKRLQWPTLALAGILQTIPGIALLALMVPILGQIGFLPALIALTIYSFMPILRNTVTGILEVDEAVSEAARGIGMTDLQRLLKIELPLSMPVIIAGIRTAAVWVVGTATLATPVGATSLGNYIFSGLQTQNLSAVIVGCVFAALLAIVLDLLIRLIEIAAARRSIRLGIISTLLTILLLLGGMFPALVDSRGPAKDKIIVGSKPFSEQYILADLLALRLRNAGFEVDKRPGMGSIILFQALTKGEVDCYVDYSGTIWSNVMNRNDIPDRDTILSEIKSWLMAEYGILCPGTLGFENTYSLAIKAETAKKYNLEDITDLAPISGEFSMASDYEFFGRPEWESLCDTYNLEFNDLISMDPSLMYQAIDKGRVDVISAYSTDGRIAAYDLVVLDDPRQAIPPYDAILLISPENADNAAMIDALSELLGAIDNELMRRANMMVDLENLPSDSAADFLNSSIDPGK